MAAVRAERGLAHQRVPAVCILDFDGDLSDHLAATGRSAPFGSWACFHTSMRVVTVDGVRCGVVPRTIGGPYAVLVAEQLWAAGARLIVGITSAGRVSAGLPLPSVVVVSDAVRDEGTSLHYLTPASTIATPTMSIIEPLVLELRTLHSQVCSGRSWTTDAPYRETAEQLRVLGRQRRPGRRDAGCVTVCLRDSSTFECCDGGTREQQRGGGRQLRHRWQ